MSYFTLDVFDIEPEVKEKIKGLVEKNNKEWMDQDHKWFFNQKSNFFNITCEELTSEYFTTLKNILFNEVQEDQYTLEVNFGEEVLGTAYILEEKVRDNMEESQEEKFNRFELSMYLNDCTMSQASDVMRVLSENGYVAEVYLTKKDQ